jgi:hypothetical protein
MVGCSSLVTAIVALTGRGQEELSFKVGRPRNLLKRPAPSYPVT